MDAGWNIGGVLMKQTSHLDGATVLLLLKVAAVVQLLVMILLATDRLGTSSAVPLLALVLIFGLIPAAVFAKANREMPFEKKIDEVQGSKIHTARASSPNEKGS